MPVWNKPNKPHPNSNRFHSNNSGGGSGGGGNNNGPSPPGGGGGGHHNSNNNNNKPPYYHHNSRRNSNPFHHNNNNHYNSNNNNNSNSNNNSFNNNKNNNHSYHHRPNHHNNHINRPNFGGGHHSNRGRGGNHRSNFQSSSHYHSSSNSNSIGNSNNNNNSNSIGNNNSISNITNNNSSSNYGVGSNNANNVSGNSSGKTIGNMNRDNHNNNNSNTGSTMNTGLNTNNKIISGNNNNNSGIGNRTLSMSASGSMSMSSSIPSSVKQKEQQQQPSHQRNHSSVEEGEIGEISSVSKMDTSSKNRLNSNSSNANTSMNTSSGDIGNGKISSSINNNSNSNNVSNKFIPPLLSTATPSSSISISSLKKNNNNREEGEIQPSPTAPSSSMSMPMSKSISTPNSISNNRSNIHNNNNHNNTSTISSSAFNNSSNSNSNSNTNATPNTNTNKPTWTPPPGASSSSNTNTSNTNTMNNNIGSMSTNMGMNIINSAHTHAHHNNNKPKLKPTNAMNNAPNHYYHGRNNNSNNIGLNANSINSNSGSNMNNHGPPRKNNWGGSSQYNHNNNTNNSYNSNREQSREHIRERDDGMGNNSQKWDKPNHLKKRFSSDGVTSGSNSNSNSIGVNSGGNIGGRGGIGSNNGGSNSAITHGIGNDSSGGGGGGGFYRSTSLPVSSSLSSNRRRNSLNSSTTGGGGMTKSTGNAMMDSSSISGGPRGSHLSLGGDYYGPSSTSSEKGKLARNSNMGEPNSLNGDGTGNGSNSLYSSMSDLQKNRDNFSPNTSRKKFQPPPGKEKKTFFSSPPPPNHSNTSSGIPFSDRDPKNMIKRQATMEKIKPAPSSPERNIKRTLSMESDGRKHVSDTRWKPAGSSNFDASTGISASANKSSTRSPPAFNTDKKKNKSSTNISGKERASLLGQQKAEPRIVSSSSVLSAPSLKNKDSMILNNKSASSIEGAQSSTSGPTPTPQSKLTCAALGRVNSMPLPSKDQIHHGMKNLESEIVRRKSDCDKMKAAHEKEEKERKKQQEEKAKAIAEAARKKEQEEKEKAALEKERAAQERLREQEARKDSELKMNNHIKEVTERIEKEKKAEESRLKTELDEMKASLVSIGKQIEDQKQKQEEARVERKRLILEAETKKSLWENSVVIAQTEIKRKEARKAYALANSISEQSDKKVKSAKLKKLNAAIKLKESSKATAEIIADTSVPELVESNNRLSEKISTSLKNILSLTKDEPKDMTNLISSIYQQNREVAYEAHQKALSLISCAPNSDSVLPPALVQEQPIDVDDTNAVRQYTNHWSNLTRQVTGPGDALYTEPSEAPLYKSNSENHKSMKSLVKERVMSKKRKLHSRWVELAEEYTIREQKYSKGAKIDASSFTSADVGDLPILAGTNDYNPDVGSSGRSSGNPYRRARRGVASGSDAVRSEYEQEQIIAQLVAKENMEKRIKLGRSELPRQKCQLEKELLVSYRDTLSSRRVFDPLEEALDQRNINPWSDIEKCIFLDRFLQHPKDFRKIASFLKNKSVHDCISFYYDSKQSVPYKRALREHSKRKKRRGDSVKWEATIQAAISVGASVNVGISSEKPLIFDLPRNDLTFNTRHFHPMGRKIFDVVSGADSHSIEIATIQDVKKNSHRKRSIMVGNLFTLDASKRKYLRSYPDMIGKSIGSGSDDLDEKQKVRRTSDSPSVHDSAKKEKSEVSKKIPQKWSTEEKTIFYEMIEKVGKKWDILSQAVGTKTAIQVKNFYCDNKKHINKNRAAVNPKVSTSTNPIEEQKIPPSVNPPTEEVKPTPVVTQPQPTIEATEAPKVNHGFTQENVIGNQPQEQEREPVDQGHQIQSNQNQTEHWMHDNQKRQQLALAIEHHRQQQQFAEQQQQHRMSHQLSQSQQQQLLEFQRQQQQQRQLSQHHHHLQQQHQHHQLQNLLNHRQNEYSHGHQQQMMSNLNWVAVAQAAMEARQQQQRPYQDYLESGTNLQNVTMALRQATQHQQNNYQLGLNSNRSADNDGSQMQQTSDLSLLAQMAVNRNRQDSRNH